MLVFRTAYDCLQNTIVDYGIRIMNLYEFLLTLTFWQWIGVITLVAIPCQAVVYVVRAIFGCQPEL